jgi:hypothetical protein
MILSGRHAVLLFLVIFGMLRSPAQSPVRTNATPAQPSPRLPPVPPTKSPVNFFRELLAMPAAERKQALAERSPEARKQILAKVREYEALRPDLRELRLKVTELHYYILPLLSMAPTNRSAQLATIPAEDRKLLEDRLRFWDALPSQNQAALLTNQAAIRRLTELEEAAVANTNLSLPRLELLGAGIRQWQALSEEDRQNIKARFDQVFSLTPEEKAKVLRTLSAPERDQIQKTLRRFGQLPPAQRAQCLNNFEKFANLSVEERQQFLKNADRWNQLTPDERQGWRDVVQKMQPQPPIPPGALPITPKIRPPPKGLATGTNQN